MSEALDFHGRAVLWGLRQLNQSVDWWDRTLTPVRDEVTVTLTSCGDSSLAVDGTSLTLDEGAYKSIWNRRGQQPTVDPELCDSDKTLARHEAKFLLEGVVACIEDRNRGAMAVNSVRTKTIANSKLHQLVTAARAGFTIPETIFSNSPKKIRGFAATAGQGVIVKMHIPYSWRDASGNVHISGTMPISDEDLKSDRSLKSAPMIFQHKLKSHSELRVVVFGRTALAISQSRPVNSKGFVDLRWEEEVVATEYDVPPILKGMCLRFMAAVGINYAAFDILVDEDGGYTFLEANEAGQFLFLEEQVPSLPMLDAFCQYLASGSPDFEYRAGSGLTLAQYMATDDATDCRELIARHWRESDKFSPFELAE
ncbi:hypothetical protein [Stenotrophomonas sp. CFBP8980]|uniref:hypothetical protein n=1 Tax=Stenotrophomonas sp. CFBP8980 TaxID=3096523 RepID=UPI002A6A21FD|nr:hypothetical protein [Stenotrophomonas sp. CFBP8980]MDY1034231.1 hypothetical protein [Stenotrophomonas sp. CFBP8980]